jgi:hypothetical protein
MTMREYALIDKDKTTGWDASAFEINARNSFGMRPIEVAAQAANVAEFDAIRNHPDFDPRGAGPEFFANVGRMTRDGYAGDDAVFARISRALWSYKEQFPYDEALKTRVKTAGEPTLPVVSADDSIAARAAKERFLAGLRDAPATEAPDSPVVRYRPA